jgi:transcription termination factor NusB
MTNIFGWEVDSDRVFEYFVENTTDYVNHKNGSHSFALLKSEDTYFLACICGTSLECHELQELIDMHMNNELLELRNKFGGTGKPKLFIL